MRVFVLTNPEFTGDNNQVLGINASLNVDAERIIIAEADFQVDMVSKDDIVLLAGDHGLRLAQQIQAVHPKALICWSGHQHFQELGTLKFWPSIIALPKAVGWGEIADFRPSGTSLVATDGVATNAINSKSLEIAATKFRGILPECEKFDAMVGIIIAGDAPTADKTMKCFTPSDAREQAQQIVQHLKVNGLYNARVALMVTNGPRTGKHDPASQDSRGTPYAPDPHRSGHVDKSSLAFIEALEEGFPGQLFFSDFQFGEQSAYQPMMDKLVQAAQSTSLRTAWYVPAESTSMVSESAYLANKGIPVVVYCPSSTNEEHMKVVIAAREHGQITALDQPIPSEVKRAESPGPLAAEQISATIELKIRYRKQLEAASAGLQMHGTFECKKHRIGHDQQDLHVAAAAATL